MNNETIYPDGIPTELEGNIPDCTHVMGNPGRIAAVVLTMGSFLVLGILL